MRKRSLAITGGIIILSALSAPAQALNYYLAPESSAVNVGDVFGVDIGFNNDASVLLNGAVVTFSYDKNYLELQDTDAGNVTGTGSGPAGINIMDAGHFPGWDANIDMISNLQQQYMSSDPYAVHYEAMYTSDASRNGVFGRAYFKALQPVSLTQLSFGPYYGFDEGVYIDPGFNAVNVTGNAGASLAINAVPEPSSLLLLGLGIFAVRRQKLYVVSERAKVYNYVQDEK